jgi:hypothetical protein
MHRQSESLRTGLGLRFPRQVQYLLLRPCSLNPFLQLTASYNSYFDVTFGTYAQLFYFDTISATQFSIQYLETPQQGPATINSMLHD